MFFFWAVFSACRPRSSRFQKRYADREAFCSVTVLSLHSICLKRHSCCGTIAISFCSTWTYREMADSRRGCACQTCNDSKAGISNREY